MANPAPDTREDVASSEPPTPLTNIPHPPSMATPTVATHKDAPPFELPDIPERFGEDNGEFYSRYDALAEDLDNKMVDKLKKQLDAHLIFAGLFAGVNSTFLALTLPLLNADPADDTNALLRENNAILLQLALNRNDSLPIANALPSETFSASGRLLTVNILFSISLTFALMSSLFAVLGQQWLVEYRSHSGSGADNHRRERMNRYLGARRWRLAWLLGDLVPTLLQIGLILFGISLTIYLSTLHPTLTKVVGAFMGAGMGFLVCTAIFALWDPFCPFQTPLSRVITLSIRATSGVTIGLIGLAVLTAFCSIAIPLATVGSPVLLVGSAIHVFVKRRQWTFELQRKALDSVNERLRQFRARFFYTLDKVQRRCQFSPKGGAPKLLEVEAVRRVIYNSNDSATLITCITNVLAIQDHQVLQRLAMDPRFGDSLSRLCRTAYLEVLRLQGQDQTELATVVTWRYRAALTHVGLCGATFRNLIVPKRICTSVGIDDKPGVSIPSDLIKASTPVQINGYLAYAAVSAWNDAQRFGPSLGRTLEMEFERLIDSNWRRISIMVMCIRVTCRLNMMSPLEVHIAFSPKPSTILQNLRFLLKECNDPSCPAHTKSKKYLVHIFKFIGKTAIDSSGPSTIKMNRIARFLRLSELFLRTEECPPEYSPVARGVRRDLVSALRSKSEEITDTDYRIHGLWTKLKMLDAWLYDLCDVISAASTKDFTDMASAALLDLRTFAKMPLDLRETLFTLSQLFSDLTAVGNRLTISSNDDDLELAYLLSPVLQRLDELQLGHRFKLRVRRLHREFGNFTSTVDRVTKLIKSPDRDPEHRWCHWREEWRSING